MWDTGRGKSYNVDDMKLIWLGLVPLWLSSAAVSRRCCKPRADEAQSCEKQLPIRYHDTTPTLPCPAI